MSMSKSNVIDRFFSGCEHFSDFGSITQQFKFSPCQIRSVVTDYELYLCTDVELLLLPIHKLKMQINEPKVHFLSTYHIEKQN